MIGVGDLSTRLPVYYAAHALLIGLMLVAWRRVSRSGHGLHLAILMALVFRLISAFAEPSLSDDVYRYVWDGRVQLHGFHPYVYAPADPALEGLRDANWSKVNHPDLRTVYPPLAQILFLALSALGAGPLGFKLVVALGDFGVVLALGFLLRRLELPQARLILYAWNPLAVIETAGSGHIEPVGAMLVLLAVAWIIKCRPGLSTLALGAAVHIKLLPVVLLPGYLRRYRLREVLLLGAVLVALLLPYAVTGPAVGAGTLAYAERWERNAVAYAGVLGALERIDPAPRLKAMLGTLKGRLGQHALPWDWLYRHVWPRELARGAMLGLMLVWIVWLAFRPGLDVSRETFWVLGGALLLSPTLHPWYLLWVLPFAAAYVSRGWLLLAALVPLAYWSGDEPVPAWIRVAEYAPPLLLALWDFRVARLARARR